MKSGIVIFFVAVMFFPAVLGSYETKEFIEGEQGNLSCVYNGELVNEGMILSIRYKKDGKYQSDRLAFLDKDSNFVSIKGDGSEFMKKLKTVEPSSSAKNSLTLSSKTFPLILNEKFFQCAVVEHNGFGNTVWKVETLMKVVAPPTVTLKPNEKVIKRAKDSKEDIVVSCNATGLPRPTIKWMRNGKVVPSTEVNGEQQLRMKAPITIDYDGDYDCVAQVESELLKKKGRNEAKDSVRISILYKPTLKIDRGTIYTDLDQRETIKIDVSGNPQPQLNCSMLQLPEPKTIRLTPYATHHRLVYEVTILKVKERDIRNYECKAWNDQGSITDNVQLTLTPSAPKVLSSNSSTYSDYYLLNWSVKSRAPMRNVTVEVHVRTENSTKLIRTDTFKLEPNVRVFSHHIANLTDNTVHELRLKACNSRGCGKEQIAHAFRTQQYDGTNTVDPMVVKVPVTVAPFRSGKIQAKGGLASTVSPLPWAVILLSALLTFNH